MFYEDALVAARALDLTLTSRSKDAGGNGVPMCGVPFHAAEGYLTKLVKKGFRVAICEQVEDPRKAKGLVKREVVRVVSPGTLTDASYLEAREPAFLMAIVPSSRDSTPRPDAADHDRRASLAVQTRQERCVFGSRSSICLPASSRPRSIAGGRALRALRRDRVLRPRKWVIPADSSVLESLPEIARCNGRVTTAMLEFRTRSARRTLLDQLRAHGLEGFGLEGQPDGVQAAGGLVHHLRDTQKADSPTCARSATGLLATLIVDAITFEASRCRGWKRRATPGLSSERGGSDGDVDGRTSPSASWLLRPLVPGTDS